MLETIKVLDKGCVTLLNISGPVRRAENVFDADDTDPANAARMSFGGYDKVRTREDDLKLADYLMRNWHTSPFEMIQVWLDVKLPIFVARQFIRHRTASVNEVSARYTVLPEDFYIPDLVRGKGGSNKQGSIDNLADEVQEDFRRDLQRQCTESYRLYLHHLGRGVAPETARLFLHVNHYTRWLWRQDLHNLMHLLALRVDAHAQQEAQEYAGAIRDLLRVHLPESMKLFDKYRVLR